MHSSPMATMKSCSAIGRAKTACGPKPRLRTYCSRRSSTTRPRFSTISIRCVSKLVRPQAAGMRQEDTVLAGGAIGKADLTAYGAVLGNFPSILDSWRRKGCRAELFFPAIDPVMANLDMATGRSMCFLSAAIRDIMPRAQRFWNRSQASPSTRQVVYCLDASRLTLLAESPLGRLLPLRKHRRPDAIAEIAKPPIFGRQLYDLIGKSKIVLNGAIDMAGRDRGNMRCFEAMGCGALLVSDAGNYPRRNESGRDHGSLHVRGAGSDRNLEESGQLAAIGGDRHARTEAGFQRSTASLRNGEFCRSRRADKPC